jgi:hypothetical protein
MGAPAKMIRPWDQLDATDGRTVSLEGKSASPADHHLADRHGDYAIFRLL